MTSTLFILCLFYIANGHMKFVYPPPRYDSANIKGGPCGSQGFNVGTITNLEPNSIITLEIIETIHHRGAPYRIALSHVSDDTYSDCILLNHIPQHTQSKAATLYIDIEIPNVNCSLCAIQVVSIMTDKIGTGNTCEYLPDGRSGSCFSNYHSCSNVNINGDINRDNLQCSQPTNWPYGDLTWNMYTQESSDQYWCIMKQAPLQLKLITNGSTSCPEISTTLSPTSAAPTHAPSGIVTTSASEFNTMENVDMTTMDTTSSSNHMEEPEVSTSDIMTTGSINMTTITDFTASDGSMMISIAKWLVIAMICIWMGM